MAKADASMHATTRYLRITDALIEEVQRTHREGAISTEWRRGLPTTRNA